MRITIDLDEAKLERVMALAGITTPEEVAEVTMSETERLARAQRILERPFYVAAEGESVIEPSYDLRTLRGAAVIRP